MESLLENPNALASIVAIVVGLTILLFTSSSPSRSTRKPKPWRITVPKEAEKGWTGEFITDNHLRLPDQPKLIQCYDPATGYKLGTVPAMTPEEVQATVDRARAAQVAWAQTSFAERIQVLELIYKYVLDNQEIISRVAARDSGKTLVDASFGEVLVTLEKIRWTVANGESVLKTQHRSVPFLMMHKSARVEYVPLGVVSAIVSWNYPFHNFIGPVISAIFAGNSCVVKVSEYTSWSSQFYVNIVREAFVSLGHSPDIVSIVTGFADAGEALVRSGVDKVTFIGSPHVGKLVMKVASDSLTPVVLELGGKDVMVVCDDADLNQTFNLAMRGFFQNCGQNCIGLERLLVQRNIYDKVVAEFEKRVKALRQGAPLEEVVDVGAMTMPQAYVQIEQLIEDAVQKGARLLFGGKRWIHPKFEHGSYIQPTLLVDVTTDMKIAQVEVFGPVVVIMAFDTDEDAIRITNTCPYGLGSSVFSTNLSRAEKIAGKLRTGMCNINDFAVNYLCQSLPFGGVKISGFDRFAGPEGLKGNCLQRAITSDRVAGVRTDIPPPINYPVGPEGFAFVESLCQAFYGNSIGANIQGLVNLAVGALSPKATATNKK